MSKEYKVEFLKTNKTILVKEGESVLRAAIDSGMDMEFLCTEGTCGTCRVKLVSGEITYKHQPDILDEEDLAEGIVLLCIAAPKSDLIVKEE